MTVVGKEDIAKEIPILLSSYTTLKEQISDSNSHVKSLIQKVCADDADRADGLSFLEMKVHLVLEYLMNLTYTMLLKIDGRSFDDQPCIKRLVEVRTVLEKIRPINKKLAYQIDKLVKLTTAELAGGELHPLSFKPNLENLASKIGPDDDDGSDGDRDEEREDENLKAHAQGVYVPPKVTAMPYDDDDKMSKKEKKLDKLRQRSLDSTLLQDLRDEYGEAPEELVNDRRGVRRAKLKQREEEREQYEEDNLRRLMVTSKDRMLKRKINELDEVIKLGSFHGVGDEGDSDDDDDNGKYKPKKKKKKNGKFASKSKQSKSNKGQNRRR